MTTARPGGRPCAVGEGRDVLGDRGRGSRRRSAHPREDERRPAAIDQARVRCGQSARAGWPLPTASRVSAREALDLVEQRVDPRVMISLELGIADRRQVDEDVRRGAMGGGLAEERGDVEVARGVDVAPAGERLGGARPGRRRPRRRRAGPRLASRAAALSASARAALLLVRVARQLHRGAEAGVRGGILVGKGEELVRQRTAPVVGPGQEVGVLLVLRASHRQRGDHRDQRGTETRRDRRGAPPTRDRRVRTRARR